jgi:hypothetical protein
LAPPPRISPKPRQERDRAHGEIAATIASQKNDQNDRDDNSSRSEQHPMLAQKPSSRRHKSFTYSHKRRNARATARATRRTSKQQ